MCGIAGFLGAWPEQLLARMATVLRHRGPDGEGIWWSERDEIGLAHRRLAIIDCSDDAAQPMVSCSGRYHVVFNGEIYNFRALAAELRGRGYEFNERSDTAVLGPLYDLHGPDMLGRLSGIFAFALWDAQKKRLFAARDRVGVKPFYYAKTNRGLAFASELKALMLLPDLDHATDKAALYDYLVHLWSPGQRTMLQHVKKLLPGHYLIAERGKAIEIQRWHFPGRAAADSWCAGPTNLGNAGAELLALLDSVVADQCVADVPIGAFLSGGIDSSAIVAAMLARRFVYGRASSRLPRCRRKSVPHWYCFAAYTRPLARFRRFWPEGYCPAASSFSTSFASRRSANGAFTFSQAWARRSF